MTDRQVTCGDTKCRQQQHAESCREWRKQHREIASRHYEDTVKPFRELRPTYQREWRLGRALRKIRDTFTPELLGLARPLDNLLARGEAILAARTKTRLQLPLGERDWLTDSLRIAGRISALMKELASLVQQLEDLDKR